MAEVKIPQIDLIRAPAAIALEPEEPCEDTLVDVEFGKEGLITGGEVRAERDNLTLSYFQPGSEPHKGGDEPNPENLMKIAVRDAAGIDRGEIKIDIENISRHLIQEIIQNFCELSTTTKYGTEGAPSPTVAPSALKELMLQIESWGGKIESDFYIKGKTETSRYRSVLKLSFNQPKVSIYEISDDRLKPICEKDELAADQINGEKDKGVPRLIVLESPDQDSLETIQEAFDICSVSLSHYVNFDRNGKVKRTPTGSYIAVPFISIEPRPGNPQYIQYREVHVHLTKNSENILIVHDGSVPEVQGLIENAGSEILLQDGPLAERLFSSLWGKAMDQYGAVCNELTEQIARLKDQVSRSDCEATMPRFESVVNQLQDVLDEQIIRLPEELKHVYPADDSIHYEGYAGRAELVSRRMGRLVRNLEQLGEAIARRIESGLNLWNGRMAAIATFAAMTLGVPPLVFNLLGHAPSNTEFGSVTLASAFGAWVVMRIWANRSRGTLPTFARSKPKSPDS